jgi:hypothetical protein
MNYLNLYGLSLNQKNLWFQLLQYMCTYDAIRIQIEILKQIEKYLKKSIELFLGNFTLRLTIQSLTKRRVATSPSPTSFNSSSKDQSNFQSFWTKIWSVLLGEQRIKY